MHERRPAARHRQVWRWSTVVCLALGLSVTLAHSQDEDGAAKAKGAFKGKGGGKGKAAAVDESAAKARSLPPLQVMQLVKPDLYLVQHKGANAVFRVTSEGVILVNTKEPGEDNFRRLTGFIQGITKQPVKLVLNAGDGPEYNGNNAAFQALGARIGASAAVERLGAVEVRMTPAGVLLVADKVLVTRELDSPEAIDRVLALEWDRVVAKTGQPLTRAAVMALKR